MEAGLSQQMDFCRDSGRVGESGMKAELCFPGPATPMQVASVSQQKLREASASCPNSATIGSLHSFEASKDAAESESENAQLLTAANELSVGGSLSGGMSTLSVGGPTRAVSIDDVEVRVASKRTEEEASISSCGAIERVCSDRSRTLVDRLSSSLKVECSRYVSDAGLSLGSNVLQFLGSKEGACVDFSPVWEHVAGNAGRSGDSFVTSSREEGAVVLQLSQEIGPSAQGKRVEVGMGGEWKGKNIQLSIGFEAEDKVEGGRVEGNVEHCFSQVLEQNAGARVEHGAKGCMNSSDDRLRKRVKREEVKRVDKWGEQIWGRNEAQDRIRSDTYENNQEDFKSPFWGKGGAVLFPMSYREKAFGNVLEVGSGEPKSMVVKTTSERVHSSDPSATFMRAELLMFEDSMWGPGLVPRGMFTPSNKQEEEWGKLFALCEPGVVERNGEEAKRLSYQERFVQFQAFLQDCDEDDHSSLLDGLDEQTKPKKRGGRRHKTHFMRRPMALAEVILELLDIEKRENALRCLSGHLIEKRDTDAHFYRTAAYQLYYSCSTLAILVQEVISAYKRINAGDLNVRGSKRLANVLTCFQSIAASDETRFPFLRAKIPNLLQPFILSTFTEEVYENVRAISLSVIHLTCKECEREAVQWALESDIVQACLHAIEIGSRLSKLIALSILESILLDERALEVICRADWKLVLDIVKMLSYLNVGCYSKVAILGVAQDFSSRLIFQVVRCYTLLCKQPRALELVKNNLPRQLQDRTFHELKQVYPLFRTLMHQLLLCIGKVDTYLPQVSSSDSETFNSPSLITQTDGNENISSESSQNQRTGTPRSSYAKTSPQTPRSLCVQSPLRPLDLNKKDWYRLPANFEYD